MSAIVEQQTVEQVLAVVEAKKVRKNINPLKGAFIDDDLQGEVVVEKNIPVVEAVVKPKIAKKVKTLEEMKKQMEELALAIKEEENKTIAPAYREALKIGTTKEIQELKKKIEENAKIGRDLAYQLGENIDLLEELPKMTDKFLVELVLEDPHFKKLCGVKETEVEEDKTDEKTEKKKGGKGTRTNVDRKATRDALPHKMVLKASGNHKTDKSTGKIELTVVYNANTTTFFNKETKKEYKVLQLANKEWCEMRGYDKLGNSWEDFQALDLFDGTRRSISKLNEDNWITNIGGADERYIDEDFEF